MRIKIRTYLPKSNPTYTESETHLAYTTKASHKTRQKRSWPIKYYRNYQLNRKGNSKIGRVPKIPRIKGIFHIPIIGDSETPKTSTQAPSAHGRVKIPNHYGHGRLYNSENSEERTYITAARRRAAKVTRDDTGLSEVMYYIEGAQRRSWEFGKGAQAPVRIPKFWTLPLFAAWRPFRAVSFTLQALTGIVSRLYYMSVWYAGYIRRVFVEWHRGHLEI